MGRQKGPSQNSPTTIPLRYRMRGPTYPLAVPRASKPRRIGGFCGRPPPIPHLHFPRSLAFPPFHPPAAPPAPPRPAPPLAPARCRASGDRARRRSATRTHSSSSTSPSARRLMTSSRSSTSTVRSSTSTSPGIAGLVTPEDSRL